MSCEMLAESQNLMILDTTSTMDMVTSPESGYESEKDIVREKEIEDTQKSSRKQISSTRKVSSMICPVCGDMATSHRHYGGLSCLSCKAFFRRAVTSSNKKEKRSVSEILSDKTSINSISKIRPTFSTNLDFEEEKKTINLITFRVALKPHYSSESLAFLYGWRRVLPILFIWRWCQYK